MKGITASGAKCIMSLGGNVLDKRMTSEYGILKNFECGDFVIVMKVLL